MLESKTFQIGDEVLVWITGMVRIRRAKVVRFNDRKGNRPILQVLTDDGDVDPSWPMLLKDGDYVIV